MKLKITLIFLVVGVMLSTLGGLLFIKNISNWEVTMSSLFTGLTGVVVLYYTIETKNLREISSKQLEEQIRPIISLELESGKSYVNNIGNGTALNIDINIKSNEENFNFKFPHMNKNEKRKIETHENIFNKEEIPELGGWDHFELEIEIKFSNVIGGKYKTFMKFNSDEGFFVKSIKNEDTSETIHFI